MINMSECAYRLRQGQQARQRLSDQMQSLWTQNILQEERKKTLAV